MVASGGLCVVALGGHAWLLPGGVHGCSRGLAWLLWGGHACCSGGACMVAWGGVHGFFDEIRSMSGQYASYWNAFLLRLFFI